MKHCLFIGALLVTAVLESACSITPRTTGLLDQVHASYQVLELNPHVERYAPLELRDADAAVRLADMAAQHRESAQDIDDLAYVARAKIALAQDVTKRKLAEAEASRITEQRDRLLLNQRTSEADQARLAAEQSKRSAQSAQSRAALLEQELAELSAKKTERGIVITLGDVLFAFDRSHLNAKAQQAVQKLCDILNQYAERNVLIEGYTDNIGSPQYNQALSERRAEAVKRALTDKGIAGIRISIRGYGEAFPAMPNDTAGNRQINRRVEIILSDESGQIRQR